MKALEIGQSKYRMPCPLPTVTGDTPEEIDRAAQECDVVWCVYDPKDYNNRNGLPNKLFLAFKYGKAVVVAEDSFISKLVRELGCGLVIKYGKWYDTYEVMLERNLRLFKKNAKKAYEYFNWERDKQELLLVYDGLVRR